MLMVIDNPISISITTPSQIRKRRRRSNQSEGTTCNVNCYNYLIHYLASPAKNQVVDLDLGPDSNCVSGSFRERRVRIRAGTVIGIGMSDLNPELQESGWEELRREARKIEGDLDVKLSSYAKLGARFTQGGYVDAGSPTVGSSRSFKSVEMEIHSLLEKLLDINDAMSRCAASATPATSVTQKLARHRDILHEFTQEFRRIKGNINSMREHAELLSSVRDDISEYKASGSMSPRMQLLRERAAIHGSISHIDDVINQAQSTRAALGSQRSMFGDVQGKVKLLSDKFPVIRGLLGSIRRRRSRDTLILSAVIAACTLFLIIYWLSK